VKDIFFWWHFGLAEAITIGGVKPSRSRQQDILEERTMPDIPPAMEVYPVHHLPMIKAYADQLGLVGLINHDVPTEMDLDAGTGVLGLVLDTLSGRSPLYR
jgi:hypothetical protein